MSERIRFGPFEADVDAGRLRRDGAQVPTQDLPFRLLAALLERPGEVLTRAELSTRLWGSDTFVDGRILVRSHLIRAADEAHVWVSGAPMEDSEAALQSTVSSRIADAVASKAQPAR